MKYADASAFRQALEDRLRRRSGPDGPLLARNRKRVAFDRLLARLVLVAPGRWRLNPAQPAATQRRTGAHYRAHQHLPGPDFHRQAWHNFQDATCNDATNHDTSRALCWWDHTATSHTADLHDAKRRIWRFMMQLSPSSSY